MEIYGEYTTTLEKSLTEIDRNWKEYDGLIIAGTHNPKDYDIEFILEKIKEARTTGRPYYGECWGHQMAGIEYARNILGIKDATSEEWGRGTYVVKKQRNLKVGLHNGESYWNNYEVDLPGWEKPENMFTAQFHASYQSSIDRPHPLLIQFLNYAKERNRILRHLV